MAGIGSFKMIKLYQYVVTKNANGNNIESVYLKHKTFGEVTDVSGGRSEEHGRTTLTDTKLFKIRYKNAWIVNQDWTIKYFGKEYAINKIERIDEKRFNWLITASAKS